jgi:histone deacetylase 6
VNFVNGNLRPVKSETDPDLSLWYKEHSRVFVAANHACWESKEFLKKVNKRRFGTVVHSEVSGLAQMMQNHAHEAQRYILDNLAEAQGDTTEDD